MSGFELVATLCLAGLCAARVIPAPVPQSEDACIASAETIVENWRKTRPGGTVDAMDCVPLEDLAGQAAAVIETAPGHFVHFGQVETMGPGSVGDFANTGFMIGTEAVAVIDTGTTRALGEALYLAIRQQTDLPIKWLILTHMHPDHALGADVFHEAGAELVGAQALNRSLSLRADPYLTNMDRLLGADVMHGTTVVFADRLVTDRLHLDLGDRVLELEAHETAHTDNDLTVFDQQSGTLWTGDLVFLEHTPALDGSINGWIRVLENLPDIPATQLVPGHGRMVHSHPAGTQPTLAYLRGLRDQVRQAIADGESLNTALRHLGLGLEAKWHLFHEFNPRNATNAYVELEWE